MPRARCLLMALLPSVSACTVLFPFAPDGEQDTCAAILAAHPGAASGEYELPAVDGGSSRVTCDMEREGGGWARVILVDTVAGTGCPDGWALAVTDEDGPRVCTRTPAGAASLSAVTFSSPQPSYREILGLARGLQFQSMDGFAQNGDSVDRSLAGIYVDGVSITVGSPAEHVWTYAVGWSEDDGSEHSMCPCQPDGAPAPNFVGAEFSCESGTRGRPPAGWYSDDPLWDGDGSSTSCDARPADGLFHRVLGHDTSSPIVVRLMADQSSENEDVGLTRLELYVR